MKRTFPLCIIADPREQRRFMATTSLERLQGGPTNVAAELAYIETDYSAVIEAMRRCLATSGTRKQADPRTYWLIGEYILGFLSRVDDMGFYLAKQNGTFARDIDVSETSVEKIIAFRRRCTKLSQVRPDIPWSRYRDNKVTGVG